MEGGSAKPLTISWFRDDGDGNGPYPVPPNEYDGNESPGIEMFTNAEGDAHLRVDNSTTRNPNGKWDMVLLHVETTGLEELDPPAEGGSKGLVTKNFIDNENWNVEISQTNGDKTLSVADNQDGYENPPVPRSGDVPPVMVFADTEEIDSDFTVGDDPDSGLFVWVDPNRATLNENGDDASFAPGEEYEVTFNVHGQTETTTFEMVEGDVSLADNYEPANKFGAELVGQSNFAGGTDVELVLETEDGTTKSTTVEVEGDQTLMDSDSAATAPNGTITGTFDLSGMEGQQFTLTAYAPGPEGGMIDGVPARDDDDYMAEENRIKVAESSGTIQDIIDPNYTLSDANVSNGKPLSVPYGIDGVDTAAGIGDNTGDGEIALDSTVAKDVQGTGAWDGLLLHYETSENVFEAIDRSPGKNVHEKFVSSPLSLDVVQTGADGEPKRLNLSKNTTGTFVVPDRGNSDERLYETEDNTKGMFFWLDMNQVVLYQNGEAVEPKAGETYEATLTIATESGDVTETVEFELVEGSTWIEPTQDDQVQVQKSKNAEIQLVTELAAGSEWTVELVSPEGDYKSEKADLVPEGDGQVLAGKVPGALPNASTTVAYDTSNLSVGTELEVRAVLQEDPPNSPVYVLNKTAVVVTPPSGSVSSSDQSGDGQSVVIDEVELSDGGFVSVHTGSPTGVTIGSSSYLEAGTHSDVEITLDESVEEDTTLYVLVHQDTNNNEKFDFPVSDDPYKKDGEILSANTEYSVENSATTTDSTATDGTDESQTDTSVPGFGFAVTLVALLAAAFVVLRRE